MFYLCYWCRKCSIFRTLKPIVFDCDAGAMNWQIRPHGVFVGVYLRNKQTVRGCSQPYIYNRKRWILVLDFIDLNSQ